MMHQSAELCKDQLKYEVWSKDIQVKLSIMWNIIWIIFRFNISKVTSDTKKQMKVPRKN